jgi:hypothetical protein
MSASRSSNVAELRRIVAPVRTSLAVRAVKAGLDVLADGLRKRCPVGKTHKLYRSIKVTRVGVGKSSVGGGVTVGTKYAAAVEAKTHFIRNTAEQDGPRAERAMMEVLSR